MKTLLVTGASGFIGSAICRRLSMAYKIVTLGRTPPISSVIPHWTHIKADIENDAAIRQACENHTPDVVIHCAGLAHVTLFSHQPPDFYERINAFATERLAYYAARANPDLYFIYLSSISVYGEKHGNKPMQEKAPCFPESRYARSKYSAEKRLIRLHQARFLKKLDIFRLAPVYDREWSLNLDKRVFAPNKLFYLRFGSGQQKMSALARENLAEFTADTLHRAAGAQNHRFFRVVNVCDVRPYSFNQILNVFQKSQYHPQRPVIRIPLPVVRLAVKIAGQMLHTHCAWIHSFYDKLAKDLVCDNKQMLATGFRPEKNLWSVFLDHDLK